MATDKSQTNSTGNDIFKLLGSLWEIPTSCSYIYYLARLYGQWLSTSFGESQGSRAEGSDKTFSSFSI